jgi:hypothetical protein
MSNEDIILAALKDIKRELGTQSEQLTLMDESIRGSRDGKEPGLRQTVNRNTERLDTLETTQAPRSALQEYGTPVASGTGAAAILYAIVEWFKHGGG